MTWVALILIFVGIGLYFGWAVAGVLTFWAGKSRVNLRDDNETEKEY